MDWFVILTPFLLIPILGLFVFVGCSLLFHPTEKVDVTVEVRFFPRSLGNNSAQFRVVISGLTDDDIVTVGEPTSVGPPPGREATYELTADDGTPFKAQAEQLLAINCQVFDLNSQTAMVANSTPCERTLPKDQDYQIVFSAPVDSQLFHPCTVDLT